MGPAELCGVSEHVNHVKVVRCEWPCNDQCVFAAGFRRPVVLFGPIADAATEKLATEMPDLFVIASESLPIYLDLCVYISVKCLFLILVNIFDIILNNINIVSTSLHQKRSPKTLDLRNPQE